jgi:hypothetical protein
LGADALADAFPCCPLPEFILLWVGRNYKLIGIFPGGKL